jgi:AcrR family transcriptional regulator
MSERRTNEERSLASRRAIVSAARDLFGRHGYDGTSLTDIAAAAALTTGAVYHHWPGKREVLHAVVDDIHHDLAMRVARVRRAGQPPLAQLSAASRVFLRLCTEPAVSRILLLDGPAVLGAQAWHELDQRWWLTPTEDLLRQAAAERHLTVAGDPRLLAVALLGAVTALGRAVADGQASVRRSESTLAALLHGRTAAGS